MVSATLLLQLGPLLSQLDLQSAALLFVSSAASMASTSCSRQPHMHSKQNSYWQSFSGAWRPSSRSSHSGLSSSLWHSWASRASQLRRASSWPLWRHSNLGCWRLWNGLPGQSVPGAPSWCSPGGWNRPKACGSGLASLPPLPIRHPTAAYRSAGWSKFTKWWWNGPPVGPLPAYHPWH